MTLTEKALHYGKELIVSTFLNRTIKRFLVLRLHGDMVR